MRFTNKEANLIIWASIGANSDAGCPEIIRALTRLAVGSRVRLPEQVDACAGRSDAAAHDLLAYRAGDGAVALDGRIPDFVACWGHAAAVSHADGGVGISALAGGRADGRGVAVVVGRGQLVVADAAGVDGVVERAGHAEDAGA